MKPLTIILLLFTQGLLAQKNTKIGELKGVDFKAGGSVFNYKPQDAIQIISEINAPLDQNSNKKPLKYEDGFISKVSNYFYLGLASKNKYFANSKYIKNAENRFGIQYGHANGILNSTIIYANDTSLTGNDYKYTGYGISTEFILNSKPFYKNFAFYTGLGISVILNSFILKAKLVSINNPNITMTSINVRALLGLKYNLSCEYNLFMESNFGENFYPKKFANRTRFIETAQFAFGIRYKFINPEERTKNKANVFW